jgi:GNAT superfamily N-acetyltransferase
MRSRTLSAPGRGESCGPAMPSRGNHPSTGEVVIRRARLEDVGSLQRHCYHDQRVDGLRDYWAWCLDPRRSDRIVRLVAVEGGQAVGTVELTCWSGWGEVGSLIVAPAFRRRGVGRQLPAALAVWARLRGVPRLALMVGRENHAARRLYAQAGFFPLSPDQAAKEKLFPCTDAERLVYHRVLPAR